MWGIVGKLVNENNMSDEGDTTFGGDTTLGLQGYNRRLPFLYHF